MKNTLLFAALFLALFSTSCKKDKKAEDLIIGKWTVTSMIADGDNLVYEDDEYKSEIELEFTESGSMILTITETDKTVTPAESESYSIPVSYSVDGDNLTITLSDGIETLESSGPLDIDSKHFSFTATNAGGADFIASMEADKK